MFNKKRLPLIVPLIIIFFLLLSVPPYKSVHFKSGFLFFLRSPLRASYNAYITLFKAENIFHIYSDYLTLKHKSEKMQYQLNKLKEVSLENDRLRKLLDLKQRSKFKLIAARVIGKDPSNWLNSLIIDKGTSSGIRINMAVMSLSGLIGKVIEAGPYTAKILLISDVNSRVVVLLQRTRQNGMLEGAGQGLCRMKYLPLNADVELGDVVESAGVGGVYPKGIAIGKVQSVRVERGGIYKSCIVKPFAELNGIEEVLCIRSGSKK